MIKLARLTSQLNPGINRYRFANSISDRIKYLGGDVGSLGLKFLDLLVQDRNGLLVRRRLVWPLEASRPKWSEGLCVESKVIQIPCHHSAWHMPETIADERVGDSIPVRWQGRLGDLQVEILTSDSSDPAQIRRIKLHLQMVPFVRLQVADDFPLASILNREFVLRNAAFDRGRLDHPST